MTENEVQDFFKKYEQVFMQSLQGRFDPDQLSALYAPEFIAASPLGVLTGKNDTVYMENLKNGYEQYRKIGTRGMHVRNVTVSPIDEMHCVAHVAWTAEYSVSGKSDVSINFNVHYLMQEYKGKLRVFGWISGDEQEALKEKGII